MSQNIQEGMTSQYKVVRDPKRIKNEKKLRRFLAKYAEQVDTGSKGSRAKS